MKSFFTLRLQLVLLVAVLFAVMTVGAGTFLIQQAQDALIQEKSDKVSSLTRQMALQYEAAMDKLKQRPDFASADAKSRRTTLEAELSSYTAILSQAYPNIFYGYWLYEFGSPIAYRPQTGISILTSLAARSDLMDRGEVVGWAYAFEDQSVVNHQLNVIRTFSWQIIAIVLAIGILGAFWIGTNLSRGVTRIKGGLLTMESDLSARIPRLSGEMGQIGGAVNKLAAALEQARDYTRYVLENISTGIVSLDQAGIITVFNPAAAKLLRIPAEDALGHDYQEALGQAKVPQAAKMVALLREHKSGEQALVLVSTAGEPIELGLSVVNLRTASQQEAGKALTIEDLSTKRKLEELLRRADRLAALGLFTTGIAHEVRNPLAAVKGYAQLLLSRKLLREQGEKYAEVIVAETERLDQLLSQLLTFARPSPPQMVRLELRRTLENTLALVEPRAREQGVAVVRQIQPTPAVLVDENQVQQVFWNLLLNAIQAMPQGGTLTVALRREKDEALAIVMDTGTGIPVELQDKVFDPFFTTKDRGSGLGLAISYRIVETLGGRIEFASEPGQGTVFTVRLPLARPRRRL
ncbi:MAG: ATP-binding protein [bacterium]